MNDDVRAAQFDTRFYRAILTGLLAGAPLAWGVLTLLFSATTDIGWAMAAGASALPALVVGPFLGGLVTTTALHRREETDNVESIVPAVEAEPDRQAA